MALPPEKLNELRQLISSRLSDVNLQDHIREILAESITKDELNDLSENDILLKLEERGILDEVLNRLNIEGINDDHGGKENKYDKNVKSKKIPVDPSSRYVYLQISKGKAFLEHLENDEAIKSSEIIPSYFSLHISYENHRFTSKLTPCSVEPEFNEGFLIELGNSSNRKTVSLPNPSNLLKMNSKIHLVLMKCNMFGDNTIVSSHYLDWRTVLSRENCHLKKSLELYGIGAERNSLIGILEIEVELMPIISENNLIDEEMINAQISLEKNQIGEKDRLFLIYAKQWWKEYLQIRASHKERLVKIFAQDENCVNRFVCDYVCPLRAGRLLDTPRQAARFVSLIGYEKLASVGVNERLEQWNSMHTFLCRNKGDCENHTILLCSLLLGFGLDAYVAVGTKAKGVVHTWVVTISTTNQVVFWESLTGQRYQHLRISLNSDLPEEKLSASKQNNHPYKTIGCLFNDKSFYANNQSLDRVDVCNFDLNNDGCWKRLSIANSLRSNDDDANTVNVLRQSSMQFPCLVKSTVNEMQASNEFEYELKVLIAEYRAEKELCSIWDENLSYLLTPALTAYEYERLTGIPNCGNDEFQDSVKRLIPDGHTFKAYPIQFVHQNVKRAFAVCLKSPTCQDIINCNGDQVRLAARVRIFTYPEQALAVWIMLACKYKAVL